MKESDNPKSQTGKNLVRIIVTMKRYDSRKAKLSVLQRRDAADERPV